MGGRDTKYYNNFQNNIYSLILGHPTYNPNIYILLILGHPTYKYYIIIMGVREPIKILLNLLISLWLSALAPNEGTIIIYFYFSVSFYILVFLPEIFEPKGELEHSSTYNGDPCAPA